MCECGCGELRPIAKIDMGGGKWWMLEVYPGCNNGCGTSWGLGITELEEGDDWGDLVRDTPAVVLDDRFRQWGTRILDTEILRKHFAEEDGGADEFSEANYALEDFVQRGGLIRTFDETRHANPVSPTASVPNEETR